MHTRACVARVASLCGMMGRSGRFPILKTNAGLFSLQCSVGRGGVFYRESRDQHMLTGLCEAS